ncbi:MAG: PAS domain S-box protein [Deltaproteobacteria bacterium]|nr:PAS domain S-box protein [Deltaproteobacteria bacterium]
MKKAFWTFIGILIAFFVITTMVIVIYEKTALIENARRHDLRELQLMGTFIRESMLRREYAQVEQAVLQWGEERPDVVSLRATIHTGFVLSEYTTERPRSATFKVAHTEKFPDGGSVLLELEQALTPIQAHVRKLAIRMSIAGASFTTLLGISLWWMLSRLAIIPLQKEISARKQTEEELKKAHDQLELRVEERTSELAASNEELRVEIIERKRAGEEAQQARQDWEDIFQAIGHPTMILDLRHGVISANRATVKATGKLQEELVGMKCYEFMHGTDKPPEGCPMAKMLTTGHFETADMEVETLGRIFFVTCTPVFGDEGNLQKVIHIATDITEQKQAEEKLQQKDYIIESASSAIATSDLDGKMTYANPVFLKMWGFDSPDEFLGKPFPDYWMVADKHDEIIDALHKEGKWTNEIQARRKDGSIFDVQVCAALVRDSEGTAVSLMSSSVDIPDRKRAEEALRESEERYRLLVENIPSVTWITSEHGKTTFISPNVEKIYGYSQEEIYESGDTLWFGRIHPDDMGFVEDSFEMMFTKKQEFNVEYRIQRKDGEWIWVHDMAMMAFEKDNIRYAYGVFSDITERKRSEVALRESEETARALLNAPDDIMVLLDAGGIILDVNETMARRFKMSRNELVGTNIFDLFPPDVAERRKGYAEDCIQTGKPVRFDDQRRGGWFDNIVYPIFDAQGTVSKVAVLAMDITDRKRAEEELRKHREHLEELVEERTKALKESIAELEAFSYSVSHDLRAPLRAMQGFAQALMEDYAEKLNAVGKDYGHRIVDAAQRMETLIEDLLTYSRLSRAEIRLAPVSLESIIEEVLAQLQGEIEDKQAQITIDKPFPQAGGHRSTLAQVVTNLVDNATKFVSPDVHPQIRIWAEERGKYIRLSVKDNGIGIAAEHQERIFRVFERLHGIETYAGTGIGLAIVRKGITRMGGKCGVESTPGKGSTFWVELPKTEE